MSVMPERQVLSSHSTTSSIGIANQTIVAHTHDHIGIFMVAMFVIIVGAPRKWSDVLSIIYIFLGNVKLL